MPHPEQIEAVSVKLKANVYFEGKVVSHTLVHSDGKKQTVGIIYPGAYKFNTDAPERMDIIAGQCRVRVAGAGDWVSYAAGASFEVPAKSFFEITVGSGIAEYLCSFL